MVYDNQTRSILETDQKTGGLDSNNPSVQPNDDGSYTLHFGGCGDGRVNCIPISPDWNYSLRFYQPREAILDGSWTFPTIEPVK